MVQKRLESISSGADTNLEPLGLAWRIYPGDKARVRWELSPCIIQVALERLSGRRLTKA